MFVLHDDLVCCLCGGNKVALVVADLDDLRSDLLALHNDSPMAGHLGLYHMMRALAKRYWWKDMYHNCQCHVRACRVC